MVGRLHILALVALLIGAMVVASPVRAQVETWECEPAPIPAASPESTPEATPGAAVEFPAEGGDLTVFAAASLTDAFEQLADNIAAANPNIEITFNFGGSQSLVTQLSEGGAEADVLALASASQMTNAIDAGIPVESSTIFARNLLTVVVPSDNPAGIASVADLGKDGIRLVLANPEVPAGNYAGQALCKFAESLEDEQPNYLADVADNVVSEEENVRAVLTKVELGEADAGIVYVSDAMTSGDAVIAIEIPAEHNVVAEYPIAALSDDPLADAFVAYVLSPAGQAILETYGFALPA